MNFRFFLSNDTETSVQYSNMLFLPQKCISLIRVSLKKKILRIATSYFLTDSFEINVVYWVLCKHIRLIFIHLTGFPLWIWKKYFEVMQTFAITTGSKQGWDISEKHKWWKVLPCEQELCMLEFEFNLIQDKGCPNQDFFYLDTQPTHSRLSIFQYQVSTRNLHFPAAHRCKLQTISTLSKVNASHLRRKMFVHVAP